MASRTDGRVPMRMDVYEKESGVSISFLDDPLSFLA